MATKAERIIAYNDVVEALIAVAQMDGFLEHGGIAKAMDALGPILSDVALSVVKQAIAFRNGPLLGEHQPVNTYLQKDPVPVTWYFEWEEVMRWDCDSTLSGKLIREAHTRALEKGYLPSYGSSWCGRVHDRIENDYFVVTLYPSMEAAEFDDVIGEVGPKPKGTPPGLLPTILVEYEWLLGMHEIDCEQTVELTIIESARTLLAHRKPKKFAKLTDSWWAKVEVTDLGYLVTFHYSKED